MKKSQFYKYATWVLLALNLFIIGFFFLMPPPPPPRPGNAMSALNMDKQQNEQFMNSAQQHIDQIKNNQAQQAELLASYFNKLTDSSDSANQDSFLNQILQLEQSKISFTYDHFEEIKSILNQDQYPEFEKFVDEALQMILFQQGQKPGRPNKHPKNN